MFTLPEGDVYTIRDKQVISRMFWYILIRDDFDRNAVDLEKGIDNILKLN